MTLNIIIKKKKKRKKKKKLTWKEKDANPLFNTIGLATICLIIPWACSPHLHILLTAAI
jgi:hypothetical protein